MNDKLHEPWQQKIMKYREQQREQKQQKEQELIRRRELEEERIFLEKKKKLGDKFRCHICGRRAEKPRIVRHYAGDGDWDEYEDWNEPGDLSKCEICGKWACSSLSEGRELHMYDGICKIDAEKL
jgi:hypothetical protein